MSAILVIGDALLDVRVVPEEAPRPGGDVPARVNLLPGGQGANVAVRLARRGIEVILVTALADDAAGSVLRRAIEDEGIDLRGLAASGTGTVVVIGDRGGERTMLSQRPPFAPAIDIGAMPEAAWTVVSGYLLHEPEAPALLARLAARDGRRALLGCAVPDRLVDAWRRAAREYAPHLVLANRLEAARLIPRRDVGMAITDAAGATLSVGGVTVSSSTGTVAPARDTTGAGDAFAAALISALANGEWPPSREAMQDAVEAAVAAGSLVARVTGAQTRVAGERRGMVRS
ncbi:MAG TPA: PfkB family carbohydrate kinase [Candidatus Angelobacter sp.]|nr:PfkB family carbohydrate kinase [Candidatus Angelobacter sp.]